MEKRLLKRSGDSFSRSKSLDFQVPKDPYNAVYLVIFFLGLSGHLPWNAILTAQPYFKSRLAGSSIASEFTAHFAIIFKALKLAVFTGVSVFGIKMNNKLWVGVSAMGNVLIFAIFTGMVQSSGNLSISSFYLITLALVVGTGAFLAIFECGMYSILGTFPSHLTQSFMAGNAFGGILAALNLVFTYFSASANISTSTKNYFFISTLFFLFSAISFIIFLSTDYCKYYQRQLALYSVISQNHPISQFRTISFEAPQKKTAETTTTTTAVSIDPTGLIKKLWSSNLALFFVGFVNLTVFPAIVSVTESVNSQKSTASPFQKELFVPMAFLIVSIGDFIGKMIPSLSVLRFEDLPFTTLSILRFFLIPLFLLGNIRISGKSLIFPSVLASDSLFFSLLTISFVGGSYITTVIMTAVPKKLDITEQSRGTVLLCSAGLLGVFGGSVFSLCLKLLLRAFTK